MAYRMERIRMTLSEFEVHFCCFEWQYASRGPSVTAKLLVELRGRIYRSVNTITWQFTSYCWLSKVCFCLMFCILYTATIRWRIKVSQYFAPLPSNPPVHEPAAMNFAGWKETVLDRTPRPLTCGESRCPPLWWSKSTNRSVMWVFEHSNFSTKLPLTYWSKFDVNGWRCSFFRLRKLPGKRRRDSLLIGSVVSTQRPDRDDGSDVTTIVLV